MTSTRDKYAGGGAHDCFVVAIEGYPNLLTDHTGMAAVLTAWAGSGFTGCLPGLEVTGVFEQRIEPWNHKPDPPIITLRVGAHDSDDTFGEDVFRSKPTWSSELTETFAPNARTGGTLKVKDTAGLPSSGTVHLAGRAYSYSSKTSTQFTIGAAGAGVFAPFTTYEGGNVMPWHHPTSPAQDTQKAANPKVTDSDTAGTDSWIGRAVEVRLHVIENGVLNLRVDAERVFAGVIKDIQDDGTYTVLTVEDMRCKILETTLHQKQFRGRIREGVRLVAGMTFTATENDGSGNTTQNALDFTVISGVPGSSHQIQEGYYTLPELYGRMNAWLANDADLAGDWTLALVAPEGEGTRTRITVKFGTSSAWKIALTCSYRGVLEFMGFGDEDIQQIDSAAGFTVGADLGKRVKENANPIVRLNSSNVPYRVMPFQGKPGSFELLTIELEKTIGEWADLRAYLPTSVQAAAKGADVGLMMVGDDITFFATRVSDTLFTNIWRDDPFGSRTSPEENTELRKGRTVDDDSDMEIRQVFLVAGSFTEIFVRLFASIAGGNVNHPTYDVFPTGLGIPWSLLGDNFVNSCRALEQASNDDAVVIALPRPMKILDHLEPELMLRLAWLIFKDGGWQFISPPVPNASSVDHDFDETNKGATTNTVDGQVAKTTVTDKYIRNVVKINYDFSLAGKPRNWIEVIDKASIAEYGERVWTINARNSYSEYAGAAIENLAALVAARVVPTFGWPLKTFRRTLLGSKMLAVYPGQTAQLSDDDIRDPTTGARGIADRGVTILSESHSFGHEAGQLYAETELMYSEEERVFPMAPCAEFSGATSTNTVATLDSHAFSRSSDQVDGKHFTAGDEVRVTEIDPPNPAAADTFLDTLSAVAGDGSTMTFTNGFGAGGRPAKSASKRYRVTYANYSTADAGQRLKSFQADTDGLIESLTEPNLYGDDTLDAFEDSTPTTLPERHATQWFGDGAPVSPHLISTLGALVNNLTSYKTATNQPIRFYDAITGSNWTYHGSFPWPIQQGVPPAGLVRLMYMNLQFRKASGGSIEVRVTTSRTPPGGVSNTNIKFRAPYTQVVFSTDVATTVLKSEVRSFVPIPAQAAPGMTWITLESRGVSSGVGDMFGMPRCHLGPLWPARAKWPRSAGEFKAATGRASGPASLWQFDFNGDASDLVGSIALAKTNSPTTGNWHAALGTRAVSFADNTSQAMRAASNASLDVTTGSVAVFLGFAADKYRTALRGLMGKRTASAGYSLDLDASDNVEFNVDGSSLQTQELSLLHHIGDPVIVMGVYDVTGNSHKIHLWRNGKVTSSAGATAALGSITNTDLFSVGDFGVGTAAGATAAWAAVCTGSAAEGLTASHLQALGKAVFGI